MSRFNDANGFFNADMKETLSQYVYRIMKQKGLGVRDVERNSGKKITNSHISKILDGKAMNLTADKIVALAKGLEVSAHEVFSIISGHPMDDAEDRSRNEGSVAAFADLIQKIAVNPVLLEIIVELLRMSVKHQTTLLESLRFANERPQKQKKSKR